jgi:hypothetical protein
MVGRSNPILVDNGFGSDLRPKRLPTVGSLLAGSFKTTVSTPPNMARVWATLGMMSASDVGSR